MKKREEDLGEINQSELLWRRLTICHNKFLFLHFYRSSHSLSPCCSMFLLQRYLFCFSRGNFFSVSFHNKIHFSCFCFISESALKGSLGYDFDVISFIGRRWIWYFLIHWRVYVCFELVLTMCVLTIKWGSGVAVVVYFLYYREEGGMGS